ncbi:hypothetical protein B5F40_01770 [Gordonibacter sp. An230]|uniref:phage tail protein n=1 Tax=Gordonibacter sp. An230 TaxID=1965592 RepID=UPI000B3994AF|nr:tape measure protein [Gordonibacter sp. An230]OUO92087.1 hypothetical protein B5F40_01770 [Gordonibacter sp. An230]
MADGKVVIEITGDESEYREAIDRLKGETKRSASSITSSLKGVGTALAGAAAAIGFGQLVAEAAAATDATQKFRQTLDFAGLGSDQIEALAASTRAYADQTVYELADIQNVTAQLAANAVPNYDKLAEAAGNLNAAAGGNADTFKSVGMVLTQTAGAGKLTTENWNQLAEAIPGASGMLQDAMEKNGAYTGNFREAMEKGEITAEEFNQAIMDLGMTDAAAEAATSTKTFEGAIGNLKATVVGGLSDILAQMQPAMTGAINGLNGFIAGIPAALSPLGDAVSAALSGGGTDGVAQAVSGLMSQGVGALVGAIQTAAAQLPAIMQTVLPIITTAVMSLLTTLLGQLPSLLMAQLDLAISGISSFVSTLATQLPTILPQLAQAAMSAANDLVTQLMTNLPTYVGQMVQAALDLFNGIVQAIPQVIPVVVQGIGDLVRNVLTNLPAFLGQMISAAVTLFNGIVSALPQVVPAVLQGVADLLQQIWDAISSFDLLQAGKDLVQGLINGIASMGQAVIDAIGGVVSGAVDWAKSLLGIASPSKVFREIGEFTMQGMEDGIEDYGKLAVRAMDSAMADVSAAAAKGAPDIGVPFDVPLAASGRAALGFGGAYASYRESRGVAQDGADLSVVVAKLDGLGRKIDDGLGRVGDALRQPVEVIWNKRQLGRLNREAAKA